MTVSRLSGVWLLQVLRQNHPDGVLRRALLDDYACLFVSARSSRGAKGRLARRLYQKLAYLQGKGLLVVEEGVIRPVPAAATPAPTRVLLLGPLLNRRLFAALMAEDRQAEGGQAHLAWARWVFLAEAVAAGWEVDQAAAALGVRPSTARALIQHPPRKA